MSKTAADLGAPKGGSGEGKKPQSTSQWLKTHKQEAALGAGGIVIALALYVRSRKATGAASSTSTTPSSTVVPATANTTGTDVYSGLEDQILGLQQAVLGMSGAGGAGGTGGAGGAAGGTAGAAAAAASSGPGYGTEQVGGQGFDLLGYTSGHNYQGYNVGNGAPVFYKTPGSNSVQTNLDASAISGLPAGTELLTPTAYASSIGSSAGSEQI